MNYSGKTVAVRDLVLGGDFLCVGCLIDRQSYLRYNYLGN